MAYAEVAATTAVASGSGVSGLLMMYMMMFGIPAALVFGFVTRGIARKKGYSHGFVWGFFLGVIGMLVIICRPDLNAGKRPPKKSERNLDTLERIVKLHEQGALTDEEFARKKAELLEKI